MPDKKITYEDIANALKYFNEHGVSAEDIARQITPEDARRILKNTTEKDFSYGSGKKTPEPT